MRRSRERTAVAPDGSDVHALLGLPAGGMAEFELAAGAVSTAVTHRTVEEIWYVTHFQFRAAADDALVVLGVTLPPWPGADEAIVVTGPWAATVPRDGVT